MGDLSFAVGEARHAARADRRAHGPGAVCHSYDYVGDLAETISLVWQPTGGDPAQRSRHVAGRRGGAAVVGKPRRRAARAGNRCSTGWSPPARFGQSSSFVTGGLRVGVSAGLAKQALAEMGQVHVHEIEGIVAWAHPSLIPSSFAWLDGRGEKPVSAARAMFRPVMLSTATRILSETGGRGRSGRLCAEWKWDGIRVQAGGGGRRCDVSIRAHGDDISGTFPDVLQAMDFEGRAGWRTAGRLTAGTTPAVFPICSSGSNRKSVSDKQMKAHPAFVALLRPAA